MTDSLKPIPYVFPIANADAFACLSKEGDVMKDVGLLESWHQMGQSFLILRAIFCRICLLSLLQRYSGHSEQWLIVLQRAAPSSNLIVKEKPTLLLNKTWTVSFYTVLDLHCRLAGAHVAEGSRNGAKHYRMTELYALLSIAFCCGFTGTCSVREGEGLLLRQATGNVSASVWSPSLQQTISRRPTGHRDAAEIY